MPNIGDIVGLIETIEDPHIVLFKERCVTVRNRNSGCARCVQICPVSCITIEGNDIAIDQKTCIGCGMCATVCPSGALVTRHPSDGSLLARCQKAAANNGGECVIVTTRMLDAIEGKYDQEKVVRIKSLGQVDESLLVRLTLDGVKKIKLVEAPFFSKDVDEIKLVEAVRITAQSLLEVWGNETIIEFANKMPSSVRLKGKSSFDPKRRNMFSDVKDTALNLTSQTIDYALKEALSSEGKVDAKRLRVGENGTLPQFMPPRRQRLLEDLDIMEEPIDATLNIRLWKHVDIDIDRCNFCFMCVTFCPTGALSRFRDDDGSIGIDYTVRTCINCGTCANICALKAITLSDEVSSLDIADGAVERYIYA